MTDFKPLPNAFGTREDHYDEQDELTPAKPLVELEMICLSAALRSKPGWWIKFRDTNILAKWRAEALEQAQLMKESHIDYALSELDGYANLRDENTGAEVACYDRIWQSDRLIPAPLKERLLSGVAKLENVPESARDWHPRSNGQVLDLVHPSLYPIVYGRTLAYPKNCIDHDASKLEPIPPPDLPYPDPNVSPWLKEENYHVSQKFQWLPTDFIISEDGKSAKSVGYINNLHPDKHKELYSTIEDIVAAYVPLFERVLTDSIPENKTIPERTANEYYYDESYKPRPNYKDYKDSDEYSRVYEEWENGRPISLPDVPSGGYVPGSLERRSIQYTLAGRTIQLIVKLANIHLTPETPEYQGGSWHIEGMSNEAIAVSGIYYYSEENITESRLAFRTAVGIPMSYEQNDSRGCSLTWGIAGEDPCVNELGAVVTSQDRCIAFPNNYQHQVSSFQLKDKTKPGHRKILALFLVDPALHRPSTTIVPPQQQEWRSAAISGNATLKAAFDKLAPEIIDRVNLLAEGTMTQEEAEAYRLELMDERSVFVEENDEKFFAMMFGMCEH